MRGGDPASGGDPSSSSLSSTFTPSMRSLPSPWPTLGLFSTPLTAARTLIHSCSQWRPSSKRPCPNPAQQGTMSLLRRLPFGRLIKTRASGPKGGFLAEGKHEPGSWGAIRVLCQGRSARPWAPVGSDVRRALQGACSSGRRRRLRGIRGNGSRGRRPGEPPLSAPAAPADSTLLCCWRALL